MSRRPSLRVSQSHPPSRRRTDADVKPLFVFFPCLLKGPRRNLRNDLLIAADSITNTMSSLVKELNSGGNGWRWIFWTRMLELVWMVSPHRGRQRDREHGGFRIWARWHFGNDLFGILLLIQTEVPGAPPASSTLLKTEGLAHLLCPVAEEPALRRRRASRTTWSGSWRTSSVWRSCWSTDRNQTTRAWWGCGGGFSDDLSCILTPRLCLLGAGDPAAVTVQVRRCILDLGRSSVNPATRIEEIYVQICSLVLTGEQ